MIMDYVVNFSATHTVVRAIQYLHFESAAPVLLCEWTRRYCYSEEAPTKQEQQSNPYHDCSELPSESCTAQKIMRRTIALGYCTKTKNTDNIFRKSNTYYFWLHKKKSSYQYCVAVVTIGFSSTHGYDIEWQSS